MREGRKGIGRLVMNLYSRRRLCWLGVLVFLVVPAVDLVFGDEATNGVFHGIGRVAPAEWSLPVLTGTSNPVPFSVRLSGVETVGVPQGYVLRVPGQSADAQAGGPDLPALAQMLPGVRGYRARGVVTGVSYEDVPGIRVAPAATWTVVEENRLAIPTPTRTPNAAIYNATNFWPTELLRVQEAWMGTQKWIRMEVRPVQYNPATKTVRWYKELKANLVLERE